MDFPDTCAFTLPSLGPARTNLTSYIWDFPVALSDHIAWQQMRMSSRALCMTESEEHTLLFIFIHVRCQQLSTLAGDTDGIMAFIHDAGLCNDCGRMSQPLGWPSESSGCMSNSFSGNKKKVWIGQALILSHRAKLERS